MNSRTYTNVETQALCTGELEVYATGKWVPRTLLGVLCPEGMTTHHMYDWAYQRAALLGIELGPMLSMNWRIGLMVHRPHALGKVQIV